MSQNTDGVNEMDLKPAAAPTMEDAPAADVDVQQPTPAAGDAKPASTETFKDEEEPAPGVATQPNLKTPPSETQPAAEDAEPSAQEPAVVAAEEPPADEAMMKSPQPPRAVEPGAVAQEPVKNEEAGDVETGTKKAAAGPNGGKGMKEKTESKREINKDFQDVHQTGKWGTISRAEMIGVGVISLLVIIGVIVAVVVVLGKDDDPKETLVPAATQAPTPPQTTLPADEKFALIMGELRNKTVTVPLAETLSDDLSSYADTLDTADCASMPHECAMSWVLNKDDFLGDTNNFIHRFALASFYYSLNGDSWKDNNNWLSPDTSYCQWHGMNCNRLETEVEDIDLNDNGLAGTIPTGLALLDTVAVISMKQNEISGPLPGDVLAALPKLFVLYLQDNMFSGPIPDNLLNEKESLALLFIHGNNFTGPFPGAYCSRTDGAVFDQFSLDCSKNECPDTCCDSENCF